MPVNNITTQGLRFMHTLHRTGTTQRQWKSASANTTGHLNAMLMSAATFVERAAPQANRLNTTLNTMQSFSYRMNAVSSDSEAVRVRSFSGRDVPETAVTVAQIATTQRNEGRGLAADAQSIPPGAFRFEIESGGTTHAISFTTTRNMTNREFQQLMADAINSANMGVRADVSEANNTSRLTLATTTTGANEDGAPRFSVRDVAGNAVAHTGIGDITQHAHDAIFTVNGEARTSRTNDIDLGGGLEITLVGTSEEAVTFSAGRDPFGLRRNIHNMVDHFNDLLETARGNSSDIRTRMLVRDLESASRRNRNALREIGVNIDTDGFLEVDEDALLASLENGAAERHLTGERQMPFINMLISTTDSVRSDPTRHISNNTARLPMFTAMRNAVAGGNTLANEPPSPFDMVNANDMLGSWLNMLR